MSTTFVLSGCDANNPPITLAPVPGDLRTCFGQFVPAPAPGKMNARQVAALIAALKRSELAMSQCGRRLIAFYETQAWEYAR
jgi:hypothetical protein